MLAIEDRSDTFSAGMLGTYRPQTMRKATHVKQARREGRIMRFLSTVMFRWSVLAGGLALWLELGPMPPL